MIYEQSHEAIGHWILCPSNRRRSPRLKNTYHKIGNVNSVPNNCIRTATHIQGPNRVIETSTYAYTHIADTVALPNWSDHLQFSHKGDKRSQQLNAQTEALIIVSDGSYLDPAAAGAWIITTALVPRFPELSFDTHLLLPAPIVAIAFAIAIQEILA